MEAAGEANCFINVDVEWVHSSKGANKEIVSVTHCRCMSAQRTESTGAAHRLG